MAVRVEDCEGRAVSFLYNLVSKDSILVTAWSGGQLQIDALADEIQPVWIVGSPPHVRVDPLDRILGLAMICESIACELFVVKLDQPPDYTFWLGHPPPMLRLAIIDLALPRNADSGSLISLFVDPLIPERIYSLHDGGIDSIVLHFLPFTSEAIGKNETMRAPSVHPVLSTGQAESSSLSPISGYVALSDSFGYSWIVAVTSSQECIVLEMKSLNLLIPVHVDLEKDISLEEPKQIDTPDIISKELLSGPKVVFIPQASPNLRSVAADSIEGRSTLHQYFKLFHENYVEYAHKVDSTLQFMRLAFYSFEPKNLCCCAEIGKLCLLFFFPSNFFNIVFCKMLQNCCYMSIRAACFLFWQKDCSSVVYRCQYTTDNFDVSKFYGW